MDWKQSSERLLICGALISMAATVCLGTLPLPVYSQSAAEAEAVAAAVNQAHIVDSGTSILDASVLQSASALQVAPGATAIIDFGSSHQIQFSGDIVNSGSIYAISSNPSITVANFGAQNILNNQGAIFSSVLPSSFSGLSAISQLSLSLNAINQIVNHGTISSSGDLSISAGASVINSGVISAAQNLNITSQIGNIINSGTIMANAGNLNISGLASQNMIVNNVGGLLQSLLSDINISTLASAEKVNLSVLGGDLLANELNFTALNGIVDINTKELQGVVNIQSCGAHVTAATSNLSLGQMTISGDPTFYNTGGDITINSNLSFEPVTFVSPAVALAIVAQGNISAANGVNSISVNSSQSGTWTGSANGGGVMIVAGANFTASPDNSPVSTTPVSPATVPVGDTTSTLTISNQTANTNNTAGSTIGGNINLSGVNINTQSGISTGSSIAGDITLVAFSGSTGSGNITVGNLTSGQTNTSTGDFTGVNGSVVVIGEGNVSVGAVNTSGNVINPILSSGNILVASAGVLTIQSPVTQNVWATTPTVLTSPTIFSGYTNTAASPGSTQLTVQNPGSIVAGSVLYLDPHGPGAEVVTVSSISGNQITTTAGLAKYHSATENVYVAAQNVVINPGAGVVASTQITQNIATFAPDYSNLGTGTVTINGQMTGNNSVTIVSGGTTTIKSSIGLTAHPESYVPAGPAPIPQVPPNYNRLPSINIIANQVGLASGQTINSAVGSCASCPSSTNITTNTLINGGTIGTSTVGSNMYVNVNSTGNLSVSGSGSFVVPNGSVIQLAAADTKALTISDLNFTTGGNSIVIMNAQGTGGVINANGVNTITGPAIVSMNSPQLNAGSQLKFNAYTAKAMLVGSGYTNDNLLISITDFIDFNGVPTTLYSPHGGDINFTKGSINFGTHSLLSTTGGGTVNFIPGLKLNGSSLYSSSSPSGNIQGIAFQPYIGGRVSSSSPNFVQFAAYPYWEVIDMLGNLLATTDPSTGLVSPQFQHVSTYTQVYSSGYVTQAAKQLGLRVSAGAFALIEGDNLGSMTQSSFNTATYDIQAALTGASLHGNVIDLVVGNENIVTSPTLGAVPSITTLQTLIGNATGNVNIEFVGPAAVTGAQMLRNSTPNPAGGNFSSATLPVTTRQQNGVLNLVTDATNGTAFTSLVNTCEQYIYGNYYPFFDQGSVIPGLVPTVSQSTFNGLVKGYMSTQFDTNTTNFKTAGANTLIRVGETGWATPLPSLTSQPLTGYTGTGLPQQNTQWATWYYPAMQEWSATHANAQTGTNGVIIGGWFESYDEPWKGVVGKNPNGIAVTVAPTVPATPVPAGSTTLPTSNGNPFFTPTLTPMSIVINPGGTTQEVQNYFSPQNGNTLSLSSTNFPSSLVNQHANGESIVAGTPQEPFFGLFSVSSSNNTAGTTSTLTSVTQKYPIASYQLTKQSSSSAVGDTTNLVSTSTSTPTVSLVSGANISGLLASFNNGLNPASTIVPTDINPERLPESSNTGELLQNAPLQGSISSNNNVNLLPNPIGNMVSMMEGNAFFLPDHDITVETPHARVSISSGAAVMIFQNESGTSIFNLYDNRAGDVAIQVGDETQELGIGRQLTITDKHEKTLKDIAPNSVALRGVVDGRVSAKKAFASEFSMASAFSNFSGLKTLLHSEDQGDRRRAYRILKTAAALSLMNKGKDAFKPPSK